MPLIFYDIETTGLNSRFDQILHFAAIKTDDNLIPTDRFELKSKLLPYTVPAPVALRTTGLSLADLNSDDRLSHYQMVRTLLQKLQSWGPAIYIGFNSIRFDEEFLRQAFFQTLHPPYFTSLNGNMRGDALHLVRATALVATDALQVPVASTGNSTFALQALAAANGITVTRQHDASADVETTLAICDKIRTSAPNVWSNFLRFVSKQAANALIADEPAFAMLEMRSGSPRLTMVTELGRSSTDASLVHCLDLCVDIVSLSGMTDEQIYGCAQNEGGIFKTFRANASPMLWAAWDLDEPEMTGIASDIAEARASILGDNNELRTRLLNLARAKEKAYQVSPHPEERLHGEWISDDDARLSAEFHAVPWEQRGNIVRRISDVRLRTFARRLAFFERPDLFKDEHRIKMAQDLERRICQSPPSGPWRTLPQAIEEITELLGSGASQNYDFQALATHYQARLDTTLAAWQQ